MPTAPYSLNRTLYGQVYQLLKERILNMDLSPGTRLKAEELAEELGVSNTPLREAIRQLTKDGLVETIPYRGSFVKSLSAREVGEIYDVRMALEALAVRLAAQAATLEQTAQIESWVREYEQAFFADDVHAGLQADFAFHELIAQASGNRALYDLLQSLSARVQALRRMDRGKTRRQESLEDHRAICQALKERDARKAEEAMIRHISKGKQHAMSLLEQG